MQVLLQLVAVSIELTVEVLKNEPVGVKQLLRAGKTQGAQQQVFKLIVGDTVLLTGADVVEVVPEVGAQMTGSVLSNQIAHQTTAVLHGAPLQHAVDRYVEHNGIHILQNVGIENAALAHNNPILNAALNKGALSHCLRYGIVVIDGDLQRIAATALVDGIVTVAGLSNGADIANFNIVCIGLCQHGLADILRSADIGFLRSVRFPVSGGRYHTADVQHIVCAGYAFQDSVIITKIAPNHFYVGFSHQAFELLLVLRAFTSQHFDVDLAGLLEHFLHSSPTHVTGTAGNKDCLFCHLFNLLNTWTITTNIINKI